MRERVLLTRVHRNVIFAGTGGIHKLDFDVFANPIQMAIAPHLPGKRRCGTTPLFRGTLVCAPGGLGVDFIGWTTDDVDTAAISLPANDAGREVFVSIG